MPGGQLKLRWVKANYQGGVKGLAVQSLLLESDLASVNGQDVHVRWGKELAVDGKVEVSADLAACYAAARPFVTLPEGPAPTGWLSLAGSVRTADGRIELDGKGRIRELARRADDQAMPVLSAALTGWYAVKTGALGGDANVTRADLAYLGRLGQTFGRSELAPYAGMLQVRCTFGRRESAGAVVTNGRGQLTGLHVNGQPVKAADATFDWSGARFAADTKTFSVAAAQFASTMASLSAKDFRCRLDGPFTAAGNVDLSADIATCLYVARPIAKWKRPPPVAGRLGLVATMTSADGHVDIVGEGGVDGFKYGTGVKVVEDKRIDFSLDARVDPSAETLSLKLFQIDSKLLAATVSGTVGEYRTRRVLDLKGRYRLSWAAAMAVLHAFKPETEDTIQLAGASESAFSATGPLRQKGIRPPFGRLLAGGDVGWSSAKVFGVALDEASLAPRLAGGKVTLPVAVIGASGGKVRLGGVVDYTGAEPMLRIKQLKMLEDVPVSVEVGEMLLSRFNPIFGKVNVAKLDGRMSLSLRNIALPLSESIRHSGTGAGRIDMETVKLIPTGPLGELVGLGGAGGDAQAVKVTGVDFTIRGGRIWYKDFALIFAENFDLRFSGSVGFDDTLDLIVRVPIRAGLLQRMGVKGPIARYAKMLEGEYVAVPLRGTRDKPKLDWKRVDIGPLIKKAIESILLGRPRPPAAEPDKPEKSPEERVLEGILDILEKATEQPKKK